MTPPPLDVDWGERFTRRFRALDAPRQNSCARVIAGLVHQQPTPGMRIKPILPDKFHYEARTSSGDRLVFRIVGARLYLIDIVAHDDIGRYSRRPARSGR